MTELQLYKFIYKRIELRRMDNNGKSDVMIYLYIHELEDFCELIKGSVIGDNGLEMRLLNNYVAIWMDDLCQYFGLDIDKIFNEGE